MVDTVQNKPDISVYVLLTCRDGLLMGSSTSLLFLYTISMQ